MNILRAISSGFRREVDVLVSHPLSLTETIQKGKVNVKHFSVLNEITFTKKDPTRKQERDLTL